MSAGRVKGGLFLLTCSVSRLMLRCKIIVELCVRSIFLCGLHVAPASLRTKFCSSNLNVRWYDVWNKVRLVTDAATDQHFVALHVLGLQVQLHQPLAQEISRDWSCKST